VGSFFGIAQEYYNRGRPKCQEKFLIGDKKPPTPIKGAEG